MSPILVRPVREQLEHDRVIRLLQAKYKRKYEVAINPGNEQVTPVGSGPSPWYPDLVLQSTERGRKLMGVVEVETAESVNNLEAMSQWAALSRLRTPFHLYVPVTSVDTAKRLCADLQISVAEFWAYQMFGDQMRFMLVQRASQPSDGKTRPVADTPGHPTTEAPRPLATRTAGGSASRADRPSAARPARTSRRATPANAARRKSASPASAGRARTMKPASRARVTKKKPATARAQKRK